VPPARFSTEMDEMMFVAGAVAAEKSRASVPRLLRVLPVWVFVPARVCVTVPVLVMAPVSAESFRLSGRGT
jgi:hypothetical protein